jgi:hypothetical protein
MYISSSVVDLKLAISFQYFDIINSLSPLSLCVHEVK